MLRGLALLGLLALPTQAAPRQDVDGGVLPWSALVRVQVPGAVRCTGVLVAPDQVATAAHCLFIRRAGHFAPPGSVHVLSGYRSGAFTSHAVASTYRVAPGYDPSRMGAPSGADLALLTVPGIRAPVLPLAEAAAAGTPAMLGGYGRDRGERITADQDCKLGATATDPQGRPLLLHGCDAIEGVSGAPLLVRAPTGAWQVGGIAVSVLLDGQGGRGAGLAVPAVSVRTLMAIGR